VLYWKDDALAALDASIGRALTGTATVVLVTGALGSGRSSFLASGIERASAAAQNSGARLNQWFLDGSMGGASDSPFHGLASFGVSSQTGAETPTALEAERRLREAIDDKLDDGPLLIAIDDLQLVDRESVDAVARVLGTASAERLLVLVSVDGLKPSGHGSWQSFVAHSPLVTTVELRALTLDSALALARDIRPTAPEPLIRRIWEHTEGNPLFFSSLLRRNTAAELEGMRQLPAREDYVQIIEARLAALGDGPIGLARAAAVNGIRWAPLTEVAFVANLRDPAPALDILDEQAILEQRIVTLGTEVRFAHAPLQASIYQHIPAAERSTLHARAADVSPDETNELRHRYAAAATYDDELADRLERAATAQDERRSHRLAAEYLDWSSRLTADGATRSRRSLDSTYERLLAGDIDYVRDSLPTIRNARDQRGAALVTGALHVADNEWIDAIRALQPVAGGGEDDARAYRIDVLLGWASLTAGESAEVAVVPIERAERIARPLDAVTGLATVASAILDRRLNRPRRDRTRIAALPERSIAVPLDETYWLAWRGITAVLLGRLDEAIGSLHEVDGRMRSGMADLGDGLIHAFLGFAYCLNGDAELAHTQFRMSATMLRPRPNPLTAAIVAIGHVMAGEEVKATELLERARGGLRDMPWDEAIRALLMGQVAYLHAYGTNETRAAFMPGLRQDFGQKADSLSGPTSPIWKLYGGLAHIWADELDAAEMLVDSIETHEKLPWVRGGAAWLRGLMAERTGNLEAAASFLKAADQNGVEPLVFFAAHIASDLARVAALVGDRTAATTAATRGQTIYTRMRAIPYLNVDDPGSERYASNILTRIDGQPTVSDVFAALSDRERDVASLVVRGMSYAQIGRELFITRSTVGFHLSRIYAKTGTQTRHELSELAGRP
jgi:DNA-binding CsgD family transcriptional regulator